MIDMIRVGQTRNLLRASSSLLEMWPRSAHHHPGQRRQSAARTGLTKVRTRSQVRTIRNSLQTERHPQKKVGHQAHPLRHLPQRKRSPDPAAAGFFRCFRGLCGMGFAPASSPQQPDTFSEAPYSPDLSTAPIQCRARNQLKVWAQFPAPPKHFDVSGTLGKGSDVQPVPSPSSRANPFRD